jgi:hypothetical protein
VNDLTPGRRALLYLYGTPHLVGAAAALGGLGIYFAGVIDRFWWAIVIGLYAAGALLVPRDDAADRIARAGFDEEHLRDQLDQLFKTARKRVPEEAARLLASIREHADVLLPKLKELTERGSLCSTVRSDVVETLTRYLPDTLAGYLRLPPAYARLHPVGIGKTPQTLLVQQLRILEDNLARAEREAFAEDVASLEVQGRFLAEKYAAAPEG